MFRVLAIAGGVATSVTVFCLGSIANADVLILNSSVSGLERGDRLEDSQRLKVPAGGYVKILRPAGDTQDIRGPYDRLVGDVTKGEPLNLTIWNSIKEQIAKETTGTRGVPTGATRGGTR
jgi:hypothetical protein